MKKISTLFGALALCGMFTANAVTVNFQFVGQGSADDVTVNPALTAPVSGSNYYTYELTEQTVFTIKANAGYTIGSVGSQGAITVSPAQGSEVSVTVPANWSTSDVIQVTVLESNDSNETTYNVPFTVTGDEADQVLSVLFNTTEITLEDGKGTLTYVDRGSLSTPTEGLVYVNVQGGSDLKLVASYPNADDVVVLPTVSSHDQGFVFPLDLADIKEGAGVTLNVTEAPAETVENTVTINFTLANGLEGQPYDYFTMVQDDENTINLSANTYVVELGEEEVELVLTPKDGYILKGRANLANEEGEILVFNTGNVLVIQIAPTEYNYGSTIDVVVEEGYVSSAVATFELTDYPNLVSSYVWDGVQVGSGFDPENIELGFKADETEGVLTINFGLDPETELPYVVEEVSAEVVTANGTETVEGNVTSDQRSVTLTIPATAEEVTVTFSGVTTGVKSLKAVVNGEDVIYNLQGVRVNNPSNGLYIINGKKVVVK